VYTTLITIKPMDWTKYPNFTSKHVVMNKKDALKLGMIALKEGKTFSQLVRKILAEWLLKK